jgi:ABC-type sugar transport system ATPase subunit
MSRSNNPTGLLGTAPFRSLDLEGYGPFREQFLEFSHKLASAPVSSLSIAERQLVEIARAVHHNSQVLIMDEPTRGIDIGAKSDIYRIIDAMAKQGIAVVVISSELPELVGICDRVLVRRTAWPVL